MAIRRTRHCESCLTQKAPNGETLYFHHVLEAKLVTATIGRREERAITDCTDFTDERLNKGEEVG